MRGNGITMRKTYLVILGSVIILAGLAMLVLPGPGVIVILIGLAVMASAGVLWAARLLVRTRERLPDPVPDDKAEDSRLVHTAIARIDEHIEEMEAVEIVREQDRVVQEQRFEEDLVTTERDVIPGAEAVEEIRTTSVQTPDHWIL